MTKKEGIKSIVDKLKKDGIAETAIVVDGKEYHVNEFDMEDFTNVSSESIEDFIKRNKPENDNELSCKIGLEIESLLKAKNA